MATRISVSGSQGDGPVDSMVDDGDTESPQDVSSASGRSTVPQGSKALFRRVRGGKLLKMDPDDMVEVVNVSLANVHFRIRDPHSAKSKGGAGEVVVTLRPFESREIRVVEAERRFRIQEREGGRPLLMVVPPDGDCGGKETFESRGRTFRTCHFRGCKTCGDSGKKWSPWQVQHFLSRLGTEAAISRVIQTIDTRPSVMEWGLEVQRRRSADRAARMGLSATNPSAVN